MKVCSNCSRFLEFFVTIALLLSCQLVFAQKQEEEQRQEQKQEIVSPVIIEATSPILHLNPEERIIQENINRRMESLKIDEQVDVFGASYFEIRNITDTQRLSRTGFITPDYRLGPGDELSIYITGIQDKTMQLKVSNHGTVSIPEFGPVFVWGKTLLEVSSTLDETIQSLYRNVDVEVDILKPRIIEAYITGEVGRPGAYQLTALSTLMDLLYMCGGPTKQGSFRQVHVTRSMARTPDMMEDGDATGSTVERIVVDLYDILVEGAEQSNPPLKPGDRIVVPPVGPTVEVKGDVRRPRQYEFVGDLTMEKLIELAGGPLPGANISQIKIRRKTDLGFTDLIEVDYTRKEGKSFSIADGDEVLVYPSIRVLQGFVCISGNVWHPGQYTLHDGLKLSELIEKAGGCLPGTYRERVDILRFISTDNRELIRVPLAESFLPKAEDDLPLEQWDVVRVYAETDVEPLPIATVEGEITNPGLYPIRENMRIQDLIVAAGGLTYRANTRRAELLRIAEDEQTVKLEVDLSEIRSNPNSPDNLPVQADDKLIILQREDMYSLNEVTIEGEVNQPGKFKIAQGETLSNLILKAGGLTNDAYLLKAELTRYQDGGGAKVIPIKLRDVLEEVSAESRIVLQDFDRIRIYKDPAGMQTIVVNATGEVEVPGMYTLLKGARLSEALERAGGIRPEGYKYGLVLVRESLRQTEDALVEELQQAQERELLRLQSALVESAVTSDEKQLQLRAVEMRKRIITLLGERRIEGRFIFDPDQDDPALEDADTITVPTMPWSVMIIGAVYGSGSIIYKEGASAEDYLQKVGGMTPYADQEQVYVIKPNGEIKRGKDQLDPIMPGDIIVVPPKLEVGVLAEVGKNN